jgi:hypothetical protein
MHHPRQRGVQDHSAEGRVRIFAHRRWSIEAPSGLIGEAGKACGNLSDSTRAARFLARSVPSIILRLEPQDGTRQSAAQPGGAAWAARFRASSAPQGIDQPPAGAIRKIATPGE